MKSKLIAVAAFASLSSVAAYAGGCGGMKSAEYQHQMFRHAVVFDQGTPMTNAGFVKVGGYYKDSGGYHRSAGYGYGSEKKASAKSDIVDTAVSAGSFFPPFLLFMPLVMVFAPYD